MLQRTATRCVSQSGVLADQQSRAERSAEKIVDKDIHSEDFGAFGRFERRICCWEVTLRY